MNVFVYTPLSGALRHKLTAEAGAGATFFFNADLTESERNVAFQRADLLMGNPPVAWFKDPPPHLQFWQLDSAGFDQYSDLRIAAGVANMGDYFAPACAETIVGGILAYLRGIPELAVAQRDKKWIGKEIRGSLQLLSRKNVLVLGAGTIAIQCKKMLGGFGCEAILSARTNPDAAIHSYEALLTALPTADIVINTLPGSAKNYASEDFFAAMSPHAIYASVGRGSTTNERALLDALIGKKIAGAVLDVTASEPLPAGHSFWSMDNVLLTQHTGGGNHDEDEAKVLQFLRNYQSVTSGGQPENIVDLAKGY